MQNEQKKSPPCVPSSVTFIVYYLYASYFLSLFFLKVADVIVAIQIL